MLACNLCGKSMRKVAFSRHKRGSSGAGGTWALRAPIHKRIQRPNLHTYKGLKFCTKCLRLVKTADQSKHKVKVEVKSSEQPQTQA